MANRTPFSTAFMVGGILTLIVLMILHSLAQSFAGMGAGAGSSSGSSDLLTIAMICGYFFISAFSIFFFESKSTLRFAACLAHTLLAIVFIIAFCAAKNRDPYAYKWPKQMALLGIIMIVYFLPWIITWRIFFRKTFDVHISESR